MAVVAAVAFAFERVTGCVSLSGPPERVLRCVGPESVVAAAAFLLGGMVVERKVERESKFV